MPCRLFLAVLAGLLACSPPPPEPVPVPVPVPSAVPAAPPWPEDGAQLEILEVSPPPGFAPRRVFIEPGHGAPGNSGNTSCRCVAEQDFTLELGADLVQRLSAAPHLELRTARAGDARPAYRRRIQQAEAWPADALISLHSDSRSVGTPWSRPDGAPACAHNDSEPGFTVLWSDEGPEPLVAARLALARALARRLSEAGFLAYHGRD